MLVALVRRAQRWLLAGALGISAIRLGAPAIQPGAGVTVSQYAALAALSIVLGWLGHQHQPNHSTLPTAGAATD